MSVRAVSRRVAALFALILFLVPPGCATNPATGETQISLIGRGQEIEMGRQGAAQVRATMGVYDPDGLGEYVGRVGRSMAATSERPDLPWSFEIADESTVNAFALPGGFIYLTRGIMAHFDSEAEMAAVLGHEIGHVTARHSVNQMSKQQLAALGLGLGSVLSDEVAQLQDVLGAGLGLLFLKYSRDDERQADRLAVRYMLRDDYEPSEAVDVFRTLGRLSEEGGGSGVPTWLSTHPSAGDRIEQLRAILDTLPRDTIRGARVDREGYLERIEGMVYGPDPRHGYFRGDEFVHPELRFRLSFPGGWQRQNLARAVTARTEEGDAMLQLALADTTGREAAARAFFASGSIESIASRRTTVNGFPAIVAEFRARSGETSLRGLVGFLDDGERTYQLLGATPQVRYGRYESTFRRFVGSYARMDDPEVLDAEPLRVSLFTPSAPTTIGDLAAGRPSPLGPERLAILNGLEVDERIPAGHTIKWVVGELPAAMRDDG